MPGLAAVPAPGEEEGPCGTRGLDARDVDILRIRLRILRELLGRSPSDLEGTAALVAARQGILEARLQESLRTVYATIRDLEQRWRGLGAFFGEAAPSGEPISVWIWNGSEYRQENEGVRTAGSDGTGGDGSGGDRAEGDGAGSEGSMVDWAPTFLVTPGRAAPTDPSGISAGEPGSLPPPICFGDVTLPEDTRPLPSARRDLSLPPSRFAACCNRIEARPAYAWESSPVWIDPSFAVAGLHLRHARQNQWESTGCGLQTGRLRGFQKMERWLGVSRCVELRDAGYIPVAADSRGIAALGDATWPLPGRASAGLAALKVQALALRLIGGYWEKRIAAGNTGALLDARQDADVVLTRLAQRHVVQSYRVDRADRVPGVSPEPSIRLELTVDHSTVAAVLTLPPATEAVSRPPAAARGSTMPSPIPVAWHPVSGRISRQTSSVERPAEPLSTSLRPAVTAAPAVRGGIGERLRSIFERVFLRRGQDVNPGARRRF